MNVSAVTSHTPASALTALRYAQPGAAPTAADGAAPGEVKKAASQFEAIIIRQLLAPSIEPIMSGGLGGATGGSSGGGMYGYLLTDMLAEKLAQGGGLGLGAMLQKQFDPAARASSSSDDLSASITTSASLAGRPIFQPSTSPSKSL
jgi:flagellar protein FlgJ